MYFSTRPDNVGKLSKKTLLVTWTDKFCYPLGPVRLRFIKKQTGRHGRYRNAIGRRFLAISERVVVII